MVLAERPARTVGETEVQQPAGRVAAHRLAQFGSAQAAGGTLSVSANASTSVTFTEVEKAAVVEVLVSCACSA